MLTVAPALAGATTPPATDPVGTSADLSAVSHPLANASGDGTSTGTVFSLPRDLDGDGIPNLGDINYITARWLNPGPDGDANGDGVVNLGDIHYITARWLNTSAPSAAVSPGTFATIPEPASFSLLALVTPMILRRNRRA